MDKTNCKIWLFKLLHIIDLKILNETSIIDILIYYNVININYWIMKIEKIIIINNYTIKIK